MTDAPERNLRMTVEYDGTNYRGWQRQMEGPSIQAVLEEKIGIITGENVRVTGSGRTDAGVHALNQVASFRTRSPIPCHRLRAGLNGLLPEDIAVKAVEEAPESFHARKSARSKTYLYQILNLPYLSALWRHHAWHVTRPLDTEAMGEGASFLLGTHDFRSFSSVHTNVKSFVRTVMAVAVRPRGGGRIHVEIEADGFLRHMVRIIVGTLVEVGTGKRRPQDMAVILAAKDRDAAGVTAPARGLFLKGVRYEDPDLGSQGDAGERPDEPPRGRP